MPSRTLWKFLCGWWWWLRAILVSSLGPSWTFDRSIHKAQNGRYFLSERKSKWGWGFSKSIISGWHLLFCLGLEFDNNTEVINYFVEASPNRFHLANYTPSWSRKIFLPLPKKLSYYCLAFSLSTTTSYNLARTEMFMFLINNLFLIPWPRYLWHPHPW